MIANRDLINDMRGVPGSKEANDALYPRVASGDAAAREQMIVSNMALVLYKVDQYLRHFPSVEHLRDDLTSAGFVGLTKAVNRMGENGPVENPNATAYISYWVQKHLGELVDEETGVGSPRTHQRARKEQRSLPQQVDEVADNLVVDPTTMVELRDLIDSCCENDEERAIVDLREKRYTDRQIAEQLGIPYTTTYMMRRDIYRRFLEASGMKGEV